MQPDAVLKADFERDLRNILVNEKALGLSSTRFAQMLDQYGPLEAAHKLLEPTRQIPTNTFSFLRNNSRLDLTMEFYVVMPKYASLFTPEELAIAEWRLKSES